MKIEKSEIKGYHFFYVGFFVGYFLLIYFLLYHPNGLFPFQVNIHFFSNVIGSLSKRFLAEAAPYALLFSLIYYTRQKWLRIGLIGFFLVLFSVNVLDIFYYFSTKTDIQFYVLRGLEWQLFRSFLGPLEITALLILLMGGGSLAVILYGLRTRKRVSRRSFLIFIALFGFLTLSGSHLPVVYSPHKEVLSTDVLIKKQSRLEELESPGYLTIAKEIKYEYFPVASFYNPLDADELAHVESLGLTTKLTTQSDFTPKKVVLIVAESLNQDFISYYNDDIPNINPFLSSLFERYPHIDAFYPSGTYTLYGLAPLLCGHTSTERLLRDEAYECLPSLLAQNGYETEFIRGFSKYYLGENVFFDKIGYQTITAQEEFDERFPDFKRQRPDLYEKWGFSDDYLFDEVIERLKQKPRSKQFLTMLTVDTHAIYEARCYRAKGSDDPENPLLFSHACFDELLQEFFERLEQERLFDEDLLVILTTDHLMPRFSGLPGVEEAAGFTSKPARMPLLFISKSNIALKSNTGSQIDVSPTILDLLNAEAPAYYMGKSLISNADAIPMGQDRIFAYMIIDGVFNGFDLLRGNVTHAAETGGQFLRTFSDATDELSLQIDQLRREHIESFESDVTLLKWYRNQLWY